MDTPAAVYERQGNTFVVTDTAFVGTDGPRTDYQKLNSDGLPTGPIFSRLTEDFEKMFVRVDNSGK